MCARGTHQLFPGGPSGGQEITGTLGLVAGTVCLKCGEKFGVLKHALACPNCRTDGVLDLRYDYDAITSVLTPARLGQTNNRTMWRYLPLLPVRGPTRVPPLQVGNTPLSDATRLAETVGMDRIWLKDESSNPTGSIEDRVLAVAITRAREESHGVATCGGTGNSALAAAALAASVGLRMFIFVSDQSSEGLIAQLLLCGAEVFVVEGTVEDALRLSWQCASEYGWYNANAALNPYLLEGAKTAGFELGEQMQWSVPDQIVVPVAEGNTLSAIWKAYREMKRLGWIHILPKMIGVQATGSAPIFSAWNQGQELLAVSPSTMARSLSVGAPRNWRRAISAVKESGGKFVAVSDREILQAMNLLGERSGRIADPGAAATLAGLTSLLRSREIPRSSSALLLLTSGGLRHADAAIEATGSGRSVSADFKEVRQIIQRSLARTPY